MNEHVERPAALAEIPMLAEYDEELAAPGTGDTEPFGVYSAAQLRESRVTLPSGDLDWTQVVDLRRRASEIVCYWAARSFGELSVIMFVHCTAAAPSSGHRSAKRHTSPPSRMRSSAM